MKALSEWKLSNQTAFKHLDLIPHRDLLALTSSTVFHHHQPSVYKSVFAVLASVSPVSFETRTGGEIRKKLA